MVLVLEGGGIGQGHGGPQREDWPNLPWARSGARMIGNLLSAGRASSMVAEVIGWIALASLAQRVIAPSSGSKHPWIDLVAGGALAGFSNEGSKRLGGWVSDGIMENWPGVVPGRDVTAAMARVLVALAVWYGGRRWVEPNLEGGVGEGFKVVNTLAFIHQVAQFVADLLMLQNGERHRTELPPSGGMGFEQYWSTQHDSWVRTNRFVRALGEGG